MGDTSSWTTALTTLAAVGVGSAISYLSQYQAWTRGNRRDAYGNFITACTNWSDHMSHLATALTGNYSDQERESHWKTVNDARTSTLGAFAQVRMLGKKGSSNEAQNVVDFLQDRLNRLFNRDFRDLDKIGDDFNARRDAFVNAARRDMSWGRS